MKQKVLLVFFATLAVVVNMAGIVNEDLLLRRSGEILFFLPLIAYYSPKIQLKKFNVMMFLLFAMGAIIIGCFESMWYFEEIKMGLWLGSYVFLAREAIKHTEYERGSKFTTLYFVGVIAAYVYLLSHHILEIERTVVNDYTVSFYIIYYLNILFLAVVALVYYLNSFSRKSVFFIGLTLSFIFADVLRDMEVIYFRDLSVEIVGSLIRFAALKMVFLFFITREKKLRLLHLV